MRKWTIGIVLFYLARGVFAQSAGNKIADESLKENYQFLENWYKDLHQHPELSLQEEKTAGKIAAELERLGFETLRNVGGHGLVGVFRNGKGPTVLYRTDMDALPIEEKTGLPYASKERGINAAGNEVYIMHACGHDLHMTVFIGTARALVKSKNEWKGTLVMVAQPAEENGQGADLMFKAGLYQKIPRPDYAVALHDHAGLEAGKLGYKEGPFMAGVDMVDMTVYGKGGHGAAPHTTIDPIVLSSEIIMAFQTIVSREINPLDAAVITVGSIHGGAVHNIIPDEVKLQLTLRSYSEAVREKMISSMRRISRNMALAKGLPEEKIPVINIREPYIPATVNDAALTKRVVRVFEDNFGKNQVVEMPAYTLGEDFSRFGMQDIKVPIFMFWLGAVDPVKVKAAKEKGEVLPSLHSPLYAPLPEVSIKTGVKAMVLATLELFNGRMK